jgi:hypothetical protein
MPKKMMSPNTTIVWVDEDAVVNPHAPTAAELNAGQNISCAIVRGYTLNPQSSDTDNTASICDEGNVETPTYDNYEASLTFFHESDNSDTTSVFKIATDLFATKGARGYLYRRLGFKSTVAFAADQVVEGFLVQSDNPQTVDGGDSGGPIQMTVPFLQQGDYVPYGTKVAAAVTP